MNDDLTTRQLGSMLSGKGFFEIFMARLLLETFCSRRTCYDIFDIVDKAEPAAERHVKVESSILLEAIPYAVD